MDTDKNLGRGTDGLLAPSVMDYRMQKLILSLGGMGVDSLMSDLYMINRCDYIETELKNRYPQIAKKAADGGNTWGRECFQSELDYLIFEVLVWHYDIPESGVTDQAHTIDNHINAIATLARYIRGAI
jgi:hypothetical protein